MKVVCIDDHTLSSGKKIDGLTVGKIYDITDFVQSSIENIRFSPWEIIDDNGNCNWYNDSVLMPLEKYRDLKLKDLLGN
jgi:hypothetical protein